MRLKMIPLVLVPVFVFASCGSSSTTYKATFQLKTGCSLDVDDSGASAQCSDTTIDAEISADKITLTRAEFKELEKNTDCFVERSCTVSYSGSATKAGGGGSGSDGMAPRAAPDEADGGVSSSDGDGLFSPIEGKWSGTLKMSKSCTGQKPKSPQPSWCKTKPGTETIDYTFQAVATPHKVRFTWSGGAAAGSGAFDVLETKGGVRAADTFYPRTDGSGSSGADGSAK